MHTEVIGRRERMDHAAVLIEVLHVQGAAASALIAKTAARASKATTLLLSGAWVEREWLPRRLTLSEDESLGLCIQHQTKNGAPDGS